MKSTPEVPNKLFYKIGEVCELTDTQPYVLRFWESEFPQLAPRKNRSGQRVYQRKDIDTVLRIKKLLYDEEYTIAGARKKLDEEHPEAAADPAPAPRASSAPAAPAAPARPAARSREPEHDHPVDMLAARIEQAPPGRPAAATAAASAQAPSRTLVTDEAQDRIERLERCVGELQKELQALLAELRQA